MFSGIVEALGVVRKIDAEGTNKNFHIESSISAELYIDQSVSHNGVCLTVVAIYDDKHIVTAVDETLVKANLNDLKVGSLVNLERSVSLNTRLDGHMVQGHVDSTILCINKDDKNGSWIFKFQYNEKDDALLVDKGSICINGVSLTLINPSDGTLEVTIIPYTYEHTTFKDIQIGDRANVEFDIIGKYVNKYLSQIKIA